MRVLSTLSLATALAVSGAAPGSAWTPERNVQIVVPAGPGGGSDQLGRLIQSIITKHKLIERPVSVVNKPGAGSAEGLLDVATSKADPHKLLVALSNLYVVPFSSDLKFHWTDLEPVAIMAFDDFILWAHNDQPQTNVKDLIAAAKAAPEPWIMGGTQARNDDHILTFAIEKATGAKFKYVPYKSGGEVATQLVGKHMATNVNNPGENIAQWRAGQVKPYCVFSATRITYAAPIAGGRSWNDIPTCKESGLDIEFKVLRVIMMPVGVKPEQRDFYVGVLDKVRQTPEWKEYAETNALQQVFLVRDAATKFMKDDEAMYGRLMREADFLHPSRK